MARELTGETVVRRDGTGRVVEVRHARAPWRDGRTAGADDPHRVVAERYLRSAAHHLGTPEAELAGLGEAAPDPDGPHPHRPHEGTRLRYRRHKRVAHLTVVEFVQTHGGLPVFGSSVAVRLTAAPPGAATEGEEAAGPVVAGAVARHLLDLSPRHPDLGAAPWGPARLTAAGLADLLHLADPANAALAAARRDGEPRIHRVRPMVHRVRGDERQHSLAGLPEKVPLAGGLPAVDLPPLDADAFPDGSDHVVVEVLFTLSAPRRPGLHWRALVEPEGGAVLHLRPLVACLGAGAPAPPVRASVFAVDPVSQGCPDCSGATPGPVLDGYRSEVELADLVPPADGGEQELVGRFVRLANLAPPAAAPPSRPAGEPFDFPAHTDGFAAVCAYHHTNEAFRLVESLGISVPDFFPRTRFPIPVDPRGKDEVVNATCNGNEKGDGVGSFVFGLVEAGHRVGIASATRVVLHEFGHAVLWDHLDFPNFGFAHSPGDSLATIWADPRSKAADRFRSFPFLANSNPVLDRRHDRRVEDGWAWFGEKWNDQYGGEQVLSTTLFRAYRALGGDSVQPTERRFASDYMLFLIVTACGLLSHPSKDPEMLVNAFALADLTTAAFRGEAGGTASKVLRWSFAEQGLFQPADTPRPVTSTGPPPAVDVYVDDGRGGVYGWVDDWRHAPGIWNRHRADGGAEHQPPRPGATNHLYLRVGNRGTKPAEGVVLRTFQLAAGDDGEAAPGHWPADWRPTAKPFLQLAQPVAPGATTVAGPFAWTPAGFEGEAILAIAACRGDLSNVDNPHTKGKPLPGWRLIPPDNNIARRQM